MCGLAAVIDGRLSFKGTNWELDFTEDGFDGVGLVESLEPRALSDAIDACLCFCGIGCRIYPSCCVPEQW